MQRAARSLISEAEFLSLPESMDKIELLDGEVIVSPSPTFWHQQILQRIVRALERWADKSRGDVTVCQSPLDVRLGPNRILQPDAFLLLEAVPPDHKGPIRRVPDLCIEVLSSDRVYDRVTKRMVYGAAGVKEYWIVEHVGLVEQWTGPGLSDAKEIRDRLTSPLLPGFALDIRQLFAFKGKPRTGTPRARR